ncbi:restriction endonuclease subunit S [Natrinema altunense]|uniref:restriction endonuclease subunit S n=1 Tax=Natrinema altunense TaxID=222984 RepID=UPI0009DB341B|nr:restriction endonuclease subunit S [Natrinema altunense]
MSDQSDLKEFADVDSQNKEQDSVDWEERIFSDVIKINDYPSLEKGEEQTHVGMKHIEENVRKIQKTVKKEYKYSKPRFENGDTLFARITPCLENGKTAFVDILDEGEAATGSTEFLVMSATEDVLPKFVYYTARRPDVRQFAIKRMTGSSGRQRVPTDVFDNISIKIPPLEEQEKIVGFLDAIDTKIETNDRIIELCDSISQTIFSYWFESFSPYDEFKDTEEGDIPQEFSVAEIGDVCSFEYGEKLTKDEREGDEYPVYGSNGITGWHKESLIDGPGIIVGRKGVNFGSINLEMGDFWPIDTTFYIEPNNESELFYVYHLLRTVPFDHLGSDSAVPGLNRNVAEDQDIALPPEKARREFSNLVRPFHKKSHELRSENNTLSGLRDTILPKLLTGKIRLNV